MNLRKKTATHQLIIGIALHFPLSGAPMPPDKDSNGWQEVVIITPGSNRGVGGKLVTSTTAVATVVNDKVILINESDGSVRYMADKPSALDFSWSFAVNFGFIHDNLIVISTHNWLGKLRIDELNSQTGTWSRTSTVNIINGATSVHTPELKGEILTVPTSQGVTYRWDADDWAITPPPLTYSNTHAAPAQSNTIPLSKLSYSESQQVLHISDPKRLAAGNVQVPYPHSGFSFAGASDGSLWLYDSIVQRNDGRYGAICRLPLTPMPQVVGVTVEDTRARERDGTIRFKVSVSPAPIIPVTVELETRSGSATEGTDYKKWTGSVVLNSKKTSAEVSIQLVSDLELEWCETFTLAVKNVSNAWCLGREAIGVIKGTSFVRTARGGELPDGKHLYSPRTAATPAGLFAMSTVGYSGHNKRLFFQPAGSSRWEEWTQYFPFLKTWSGTTIEDADQNLVCFKGYVGIYTPSEMQFAVLDARLRKIIAQGVQPYGNGDPMVLNGNSILGLAPGLTYGTRTRALFSLPDLQAIWKTDDVWKTPFRHTSGQMLVNNVSYGGVSGYSEQFQLRRFSDGTVIRNLPRPLGANFDCVIEAGKDGKSVLRSGGRLFFHHLLEDGGDAYQSFDGTSNQMLAASSRIFFVAGYNGVAAVDTETGTILDWINPKTTQYFSLSAKQGDLIVGESPNTVVVYAAQPGVPAPLNDKIIVGETTVDQTLKMALSEAVSFPLSVRLISCSSPEEISGVGSSTIISPGSKEFTLPFRITDDDIPERMEIMSVIVEISGNGHSEKFPIEVSIEESDIIRFGETTRDKDLIQCSSLSLGGGSPIFGNTAKYLAIDPVSTSAYHPTAADAYGHRYGHAVACSKTHAVVGSPAVPNTKDANLVYIYDRKKKSELRKISHVGKNTAFGSVLHLDGGRLFVGSPGEKVIGGVVEYSMPNGKFAHSYQQPEKARAGNRFGISIASDRNSLWIGASGADHGVVYQFNVKSRILERVLRPEVAGVWNFGHALATTGPYLAVGAPSNHKGSSVFLYHKKSGKLITKIQSPFDDGGHFGASLAGLSDDRLAVGCPKSKFSQHGAILTYDLKTKPCRMLIMLEPSMEHNKHHGVRYGWAGQTGSLDSYGGFLGIQILSLRNPLSVYDQRHGHAEILKLRFPNSSKKSSVVVNRSEGDVWTQASACSDDGTPPKLEMAKAAGTIRLTLPKLEQLSPDAEVALEQSDDLLNWNTVAHINGANMEGWQLLSRDFQFYRESNHLQFHASPESQLFFRFRCNLKESE